jgi:phosphatidylglycerophosphatase A
MSERSAKDRFVLWVAQGFGTGRAPFAPGTFGTLVGVAWFALLVWPGNLWIYLAGTLAGVFASVWLCGEAERILGQHDPGSVVIDEIAAIPVVMMSWVVIFTVSERTESMLGWFFLDRPLLVVSGFLLFRVFDIWKPWPVKQSQSLPGGWGVTMDDVLAAAYVNLVCAIGSIWLR